MANNRNETWSGVFNVEFNALSPGPHALSVIMSQDEHNVIVVLHHLWGSDMMWYVLALRVRQYHYTPVNPVF